MDPSSPMVQSIRNYVDGLFEAAGAAWNRWWFVPRDPAPLCALRIAVGLLVVYWLATFSPDLTLLFGPEGVLPSEVVRRLTAAQDPARYSFLHWVSSPTGLWTVHVAGLVVATLFTVGLFARVSNVLTLVVFLAYVHRASMLTGIVEPVLAFALFYLCFAPTGAYFSMDAWWRKRRNTADGVRPSLAANISQRLLQMHTALVYLMMGVTMLSSPSHTWWFGDAMWFVLARPESRIADLTWIHDFEYLLNFWTHWVVLFELAFGIFVWNRWCRPILLVLSIPHWVLLALVSGHAPFCITMLALDLCYLSRPRRREE